MSRHRFHIDVPCCSTECCQAGLPKYLRTVETTLPVALSRPKSSGRRTSRTSHTCAELHPVDTIHGKDHVQSVPCVPCVWCASNEVGSGPAYLRYLAVRAHPRQGETRLVRREWCSGPVAPRSTEGRNPCQVISTGPRASKATKPIFYLVFHPIVAEVPIASTVHLSRSNNLKRTTAGCCVSEHARRRRRRLPPRPSE